MKQRFTFLFSLLLLVLLQLSMVQNVYAQGDPGTDDDGFIVQITSPAGIAQDLKNGNDGLTCGWKGSAYGPSVTEDFCGEVVWAQDDSVACDPLQSLSGKIALIRRGTCDFSAKVYNAQQAGAIAVIVVNHYNNAADGPCSTPGFGGMAGGINADSVTIPSIYIQRYTGEQIDGALAAGQIVNVCFVRPRLTDAVAAYHYATPVSQVDTLLNIGMRVTNLDAANAIDNIVLKAEVREPGGNVTTLTANVSNISAGIDTFIYFPPYLPPSVLGRFDVTYTTNLYNESRDTLTRSFYQTPYTFASDNLNIVPGGVTVDAATFATANFQQQSGSLYLTGPNGGTAAYATFGIANPDTLAGSGAEDVTILLYDGDPDDDGTIDFSAGFTDLDNLSGGQVAFATYTVTGNEAPDSLLTVELQDFGAGSAVTLKARHPYYLSILYNGANGITGQNIALTNTSNEFYLNFPTTPLFLDQLYSGYSGATIVERLQLEGYPANLVAVKPTLLEAAKVAVAPNPALDQIRVDLDLSTVNDAVTVSLIDWTGRFVSTQQLRNFQHGQTAFHVAALPSGNYLVQVVTKEGNTMRKVVVCH